MNWEPTLTTSLRRWLDAFVALPDRLRLPLAILAALVVHGLLILVFWLLPWVGKLLPASCTARTTVVIPEPPKPLEIVLAPPPPEPQPEELNSAEQAKLEELFQKLPEEVQREYLDIEGLARKKNLSKRALLESWADSVAGSRKPGRGDNPLPSQDGGTDLPFTNFKDQQARVGDPKKLPTAEPEVTPKLPLPANDPAPIYKPVPVTKPELDRAEPEKIPKTASVETPPPEPAAPPPKPLPPELKKVIEAKEDEIPLYVFAPRALGNIAQREIQPKPTPEPQRKPTPPTPEPTPVPTKPTPLQFATPKASPLPTPKPAVNQIQANRMASAARPTPVPNPGYTPHMERRKIEGGNAPAGDNGVDAVGTDRGRYVKALNQAVGSRWTYYVRDVRQASLITAGSVTMKFALNAKGKITRVQVTDNTSNAAHAALCERAFLESQPDIDPPPRELLRNGIFEDTFTFTLY